MNNFNDDDQEEVWETLYERTRDRLRQYGREDFLGRADYYVLSDNYGFRTINVALHRLAMLQPSIIKALQELLVGHPDWEILVSLDIPEKEDEWPAMGLRIGADKIVDELQRQFLPSEFQRMEF